MQGLAIKSKDTQILIQIDTQFIDLQTIMDLVKRIELEMLAKKAKFDEGVLKLSDEIKSNWWKEHGEEYLKDVVK